MMNRREFVLSAAAAATVGGKVFAEQGCRRASRGACCCTSARTCGATARSTGSTFRIRQRPDVIRDVTEVFGRPRWFHIGFDEEMAVAMPDRYLAAYRQGDLWWHRPDRPRQGLSPCCSPDARLGVRSSGYGIIAAWRRSRPTSKGRQTPRDARWRQLSHDEAQHRRAAVRGTVTGRDGIRTCQPASGLEQLPITASGRTPSSLCWTGCWTADSGARVAGYDILGGSGRLRESWGLI